MTRFKSKQLLPVLGLSLLAGSPSFAQNALQSGDNVAICGDSITEQRQYSVFIEDYLQMYRPQPNLQAMQFGWGGKTSWGLKHGVVNRSQKLCAASSAAVVPVTHEIKVEVAV